MITFTTTANYWIIEVPTGDPFMPWINIGPWFTSKDTACRDLRGWRPELRATARIRQHIAETFTAHQS